MAWTQGSPCHQQKLLGVWVPGDNSSFRVTDMAVYRDKLYPGLESCRVDVWDVNSLTQLTSLETTRSSEPRPGEEPAAPATDNLPRSCKMALHNRTLAVNNATRTKVRDRKSTRLNSSHSQQSRMPSSA